MYMSMTISNPNIIFLGCPFYKEKQPHCKFFVWVDEHLVRIGSNGCISDKRHLSEKNVEVVEEEEELDYRMAVLEKKKKSINLVYWYNCMCCLCCFLCM
ncbi:uncharacterized protein DS421_17g593080 [Arachis hypogaea]|nr:uncharacterized protein DS421_17g593080 [Arachis hypogaea]